MTEQPHLPTASPPASVWCRRHWRWLLAVAILALLVVFLPQFALRQWGPSLLGRVLSTQLHTSVTVAHITGGWLSGLELRGLAVAESPKPQALTLVHVERLTLNLPALWLLVTSDPIVLRVEDLSVNLRRRDDGQWNIAALSAHLHTPPTPAAPRPAKPLRLPRRSVEVTLTGGRLHLGEEGTTYSFDLHAGSPSLAAAPLQWHLALSGPEDAALTLDGQLQHVTSPEALVGHAAVNGSNLDIGMMTALLSPHPALQPRGVVHSANIGLVFAGTQGVTMTVGLDVQQLQWPLADAPAAAPLERLQVDLRGQWQDNQWSCDTLTITAPGARFTLPDRAWMRADEDAWRGHVAFALDVEDRPPVTQVIHTLLPPALRLQGPLQVAGQADGTVSRDAQQPWDTRLTGLAASLDASLAGVTWHQETITTIVTKVLLKDGRLSIPQISARAFGSDIVLKGALPLAEHAPGGEIDWRIVNLPLHKVLGQPLQRFVIAQMRGRLVHDGKLYRVQSVVQFPELRLNPEDISQREFRVTQAVFRCTATFTLPFTELAFTGCTIESPEMRLTFDQGTLRLGAQPEISLQLKGDLSGAFVNALVPEAPVQFTHPLRVRGPYRIPLHGNVWIGMQWDLAVASDRFVLGDMPFTELRTQVVKTIGRLDLADVEALRGNGHVKASGFWRFFGKGQPAEGELQIHSHQLPVQQTLMPDAPDGPSVIEVTVDGSMLLQTGHTGWQFTEGQQLHGLRLRRGSTTLAEMSAARLHGLFGRELDGPLWARQLELLGDDLKITVRHGRLSVQVSEQAAFEVDATVEAQAPYVMSALALLQIKGVEVGGRTQAVVQVQGKMRDTFRTIQGGGAVQMAEVGFLGQTFTAVDMAYELTPGRVQLTKGVLGYGDGRIEVLGRLGLPLHPGAPGDQGVVTLHQIPLEHTQQLQDFRSQGAATLHMRTTCNGQVELQGIPSGQLQGGLHVQVDQTLRQVRQDDRVLEEAHVPPILLTAQVSSRRPHEYWEIPILRLQGQGTAIELTHMQVRSTPSSVDLSSALQVHLSGEVSYGVTMGLVPEAFALKDTVDLRGTAGLRIPATGPIEPRDISYVGDVQLQSVEIAEDKVEALTAHLRLVQGQLTVEAAQARVLDGAVSLPSASFVDVQGPNHDFDVHAMAQDLHLQVESGRRLALSRVLFLLAPLFIIEPTRDEPASMSGILAAEMRLQGRFSNEAGWSKTVNGEGFFRIADGAIKGSTLVAGLTTRIVALPWNLVHDALTGLFARDGQLGSALVHLGKQAFIFGTIESPIQVRAGEVHLQPNFAVRSPKFGMVINGYSTLEGDLDYVVRTDIIERLRFGSITSLPNRIPIIGKVLRYVNPFTLLEGIALEVTVKGNAFKHDDQGRSDIQVHTSIIR